SVEHLLVDFLAEVVGHRAHEVALREVGNGAGRNHAVHLGGEAGAGFAHVDAQTLALLQNLAKPLAQPLAAVARYLPAEHIAHGVLNDFGLFLAVVALQLREILEAQAGAHLVAPRRGNEVIQPLKVDGGQLVDDDGGFALALLVHQLHQPGVVEAQRGPIDGLAVGVVAH
nr:hypothetical protein [Tanacetum cinerariifolium]